MSEAWQNEAQCRDVDPDFMQPEVATPVQVAEAKAYCFGCPVFEQCAEAAYAQRSPESGENIAYGVWAGEWFGDLPRVPAAEVCGICGDAAAKGQRLCRRHLTEKVQESHLRLLEVNAQKECSWDGCTELRHRMTKQVSPYCKAHKAERERLKRLEKRNQSGAA
jgi:hypothetical protein